MAVALKYWKTVLGGMHMGVAVKDDCWNSISENKFNEKNLGQDQFESDDTSVEAAVDTALDNVTLSAALWWVVNC